MRSFAPCSSEGQRRFLVADEVGLGKTKTARALVAETVKRLWDDKDVDRIDVVYICSNAQIARQNLQDLDLFSGLGEVPRRADRLTMLPSTLASLGHVNLIALTPGTSFDLGYAPGRAPERAMLWRLLEHVGEPWGDLLWKRPRSVTIFRADASERRLNYELRLLDDFEAPTSVVNALAKSLRRAKLAAEYDVLSDGRRSYDAADGRRFIGRLRRLLAEVCIHQLTPDLIILDEFQRFTNLIHGVGSEGALARMLLDQPEARVLLLSATPYKMLTSADDDESHFEQFLSTIGFLLGAERVSEVGSLRSSLGETALRDLGSPRRRPSRKGSRHDRESARQRDGEDGATGRHAGPGRHAGCIDRCDMRRAEDRRPVVRRHRSDRADARPGSLHGRVLEVGARTSTTSWTSTPPRRGCARHCLSGRI